jgi:hypothetical protein
MTKIYADSSGKRRLLGEIPITVETTVPEGYYEKAKVASLELDKMCMHSSSLDDVDIRAVERATDLFSSHIDTMMFHPCFPGKEGLNCLGFGISVREVEQRADQLRRRAFYCMFTLLVLVMVVITVLVAGGVA